MKKFLVIGQHLLPAVLVIALILGCASAPVLESVPERLSVMEASAEEQDTSSGALAAETEEEEESIEQAVGDYTDGIYTGSATGYGGTITVQVTVEDGQITDITVLSHDYETESYYNRASAVIDSILLYQTWEVDAISGATYSSNGIKYAVQNALTGEVTETETADAFDGDSDALTEVSYTDPDAYVDGTYTGSAAGYGGTITVSVTISDGEIASITIVSAAGETSSYLASAKSVISSILSAQSPNVDTVSGATYSSNGIINAVKAALKQAAASSDDEEDEEEETDTAIDFTTLPNYGYTDGIYTGTGEGWGGDIVVSVEVSGGQIIAVTVLSAEDETYAYWSQAVTILDTIIEAQSAEVDAVSGATYSSEGILEAVSNALADAVDAVSSADAGTEAAETENAVDAAEASAEESAEGTDDASEAETGGESSVTTEVTAADYSVTVTVNPDEWEDFDAYEMTLTLTVTTTVTTVMEGGTVTVTSVSEVTAAEYSADSTKTNLRYLADAWSGMADGLLAGESVDAVSGATCSSSAIQEAWTAALSAVSLGTTQVSYEIEAVNADAEAAAAGDGEADADNAAESEETAEAAADADEEDVSAVSSEEDALLPEDSETIANPAAADDSDDDSEADSGSAEDEVLPDDSTGEGADET